MHGFLSLADAKFHLERWRRSDNTDRSQESHFPLTPAEYAETLSSTTARLSAEQWRNGGRTVSSEGDEQRCSPQARPRQLQRALSTRARHRREDDFDPAPVAPTKLLSEPDRCGNLKHTK